MIVPIGRFESTLDGGKRSKLLYFIYFPSIKELSVVLTTKCAIVTFSTT